MMFNKVLIANRGEITVRICRTLAEMGIRSVAVYADDDRDSHLAAADEIYSLGSGRPAETYLDADKLIAICRQSGAEAIHPGYGFLSENAAFADKLQQAGITFIGPTSAHIRQFGLKHVARGLAADMGLAVLEGSPLVETLDDALRSARKIGFPVMIKSSAGGGGIGLQYCDDEAELETRLASVQRLAAAQFGDNSVFLERYIPRPRHIEVQAFGDGDGRVLILGDRDCSLQRRHQKVIEECPAPNLPQHVREAIHTQAETLLSGIRYRSAGTVEFLYDPEHESACFLEVNTRLQVEHGVTEMVFGVDLVRWMIELASGDATCMENTTLQADGHAIEARLYAENTLRDFLPSPGLVPVVNFPTGDFLRTDTWIRSGITVSPRYDPMLAKTMTWGTTRDGARTRLIEALEATTIHGIETNVDYLKQALREASFAAGTMSTNTLDTLSLQLNGFEVIEPGAHTTIQSYPGRQGLWSVGVPPSGPMDDLSFRLGNRLIGNDDSAAGLEVTLNGPTLEFHAETKALLAGDCEVTVNGAPVEPWTIVDLKPGDILDIGTVLNGARTFLLFAGGLDVPDVIGSNATFTLGRMGGIAGDMLRKGDMVRMNSRSRDTRWQHGFLGPPLSSRGNLRVTMGPHSTKEFFLEEDIDQFLSADWTVHYNSNRTGIRLIGPQPTWARNDGGEAGLHPSNIHDNAYAFGTVDFTGDMPVILGPDGPSLGGFVCPVTVINADLWKLGQLVAGDTVRFHPITESDAIDIEAAQNRYIQNCTTYPVFSPTHAREPVIIDEIDGATFRRSGQDWLLIEFGAPKLDIEQRLLVAAMHTAIEQAAFPEIVEMTPGVRSLQIRYHASQCPAADLVARLTPLFAACKAQQSMRTPSRIVHLPLSWDDVAARTAAQRYLQIVRPDAPWGADNIEFIRRINGLDHRDDVKRIVHDASYLVLGLGDVYLGAPVATPIDPRHRLVTTKYNPARTWTAENSVGIGGSYLCIYGMEGPGGYQLIGRTLQVWNSYRFGPNFTDYWLLRPFDQIRFFEVDGKELIEMREAFPRGGYEVEIEETVFDGVEYSHYLSQHQSAINAFKANRERAFNTELQDWKERGLLTFETSHASATSQNAANDNALVESPLAGSVWSIPVQSGQEVKAGDVLFILESMKTEFEVKASANSVVGDILVSEGQLVQPGQALALKA